MRSARTPQTDCNDKNGYHGDDDDDEMEADELELIGLEAKLLPPGSPGPNGTSSTSALSTSGVPFQSTFPLGPLLDEFQRIPSGVYHNPSSSYPTEFKPRLPVHHTATTSTTLKPYLDHRTPTHHLRSKSFSTPRKISHSSSLSSDSYAGTDIDSPLDPSDSDEDDTDVDQEDEEDLSGAECESKVLDEIERENKRFYTNGTMVGGAEDEGGMRAVKGKGKARVVPGRIRLGPTVSDVTSCLKMLVSLHVRSYHSSGLVLPRAWPLRFLDTRADDDRPPQGSPIHLQATPARPTRPYPSGSSSSASSPLYSPSSPESLGREEAEVIEAELFSTSGMEVDGASERGDWEDERMVSVLVSLV